jgi:glycosyltransferase involved in cell wall biosynthesis
MLKKRVESPRVSAVIIFFNGEDFLPEAIESVVAQTFTDWELLLADDGSGPAATAIAREYAARYPSRIRYLEHPNHANRGMSATRNLGVRNARGDLIAFLDADDVWLPSKLAVHVSLLDTHPEIGLVCGATIYWRSWSNGRDDLIPTGHRQDAVIYPPDAALALFPLGDAPPVSMSDIVLHRDLIEKVGGFEEQFTGHYESRAFLSKVFLTAPVYFDSKASNKYRQHPSSCVATALRDGSHIRNRLLFLEWLERHLKTRDKSHQLVVRSLRRALRPYRRPRIDYFLSVPAKIRNRIRRLTNQAVQLINPFYTSEQ